MTSVFFVLILGAAFGDPRALPASPDIPVGAIRHSTSLASEVVFVLSSRTSSSYVVGEGLSLTYAVKSKVDFPVRASLQLNPLMGQATLFCRKGAEAFREAPLEERYRDITGDELRPLNPGDVREFSFTVAIADRVAAVDRFLLDQPGIYQCRVDYVDTGNDANGLLESNVITLNVTSPTGVDLEALKALTPEMICLLEVKTNCFVAPAAMQAADAFLTNHGASLYAPAIRYGLRGHIGTRVHTGRATSEEVAIWERHLGTGDAIKPTLNLSPTPASIWPPNKAMVLVGINLTASDNSGGVPVVKLASITCDDSRNSADIAEAAFGTDDRSFKLRADRTGGGKGRTYTITYEAADAAGNTATATTTVVVPHDQAKK